LALKSEIEALEEEGDDVKDEGLDQLYYRRRGCIICSFIITASFCTDATTSWTAAKTFPTC
jgi:uncharacterized protein Yka (UPF0111/DUF47 family)